MSVTLRKKKIGDGSDSLYLDLYVNGKRHYEFLNIHLKTGSPTNKENLELAKSIASKRQLEIQNNEHGFVPHFKKKVNFIEYFERVAKEKNNFSVVWLPTLKHLKTFAGDSIPISAITEEWLEQFKAYLLTKVKANSAHEYFTKVKQSLTIAIKEKIIVSNPSLNIDHIKHEETQRVYLTIEEVQKLAKTPCTNEETKRAFLFACFTGLRFSDVKALTWENIQGEVIVFRQKKTKGIENFPLPKNAKDILQQRTIKNGTAILPLQTNKIFDLGDHSNVRKELIKWAKLAELTKHISFHTSRHTYATLLLSNGVDLYTVSTMLGHKNITTTQIYAKVIDQKKQDAVNRLPSIEIAI